ncbi:MAG: hypothetical protein KAS23_06285 [Anaerohalosphaera sp.]|nr:hypothetical protein [Anaerohalosphaera sp.]
MNIITIILLAAITTTAVLADIPQYNIIPLSKLTDNPNEVTNVWSINDAGQIVGMSQAYEYDNGTPILYRPGEYDNAVDLMPNQRNTGTIRPVNNNYGQIIGTRMTLNNSDFVVVAILFDESGQGNNIVIEMPDFLESRPLSTNDLGQIPGSTQAGALINSTLPYTMTEFALPQGHNAASAYAVNNSGQAVGWASWQSDPTQHAALFEQGRTICLGTLGGQESIAFSVNNFGQIVGAATDASGRRIATVFDSTGQGNNIPIGTIGHEGSVAFSINDNGWVIGMTSNSSFFPDGGTFLFDGNEAIDLQSCISLDLDWNIEQVWDINNLNQIIGWGYLDGQQRAFLMTPVPEPATLTILAIGTLLIRRRRSY